MNIQVEKTKKALLAAVALAGVTLIASQKIRAQEEAPPQTVEQRLAILERKYENDQEAAAAKAKESASVFSDKEGFVIKSADGSFQLRVGGHIQTDFRSYLSDVNQTGVNQFLVRRARLVLEGTVNKFIDFRFVPDFGAGTTLLYDAYVDIKARPWLKLRVGKFKSPLGIEQLQSDTSLIFVERGLPTTLIPSRDTGAQLFGEIAGGAVNYSAGIYNGNNDAANTDGDTNDQKEYVGRLWLQPFKNTSVATVQGLGFGLSGSNGTNTGTAAAPNLASYKTDGQETFYSYIANVYANGARSRISPQGTWYIGSLGLLGEYVASSQDVTRAAAPTQRKKLTNTAWQLAASYVLTGEKASYNGVKPRHGVDQNGWGAWEIAGRFEEFNADAASFSLYADPTKSPSRATSWTSGVNWYATSNLKWVANYVDTSFTKGAGTANKITDQPREEVILTRVQVLF